MKTRSPSAARARTNHDASPPSKSRVGLRSAATTSEFGEDGSEDALFPFSTRAPRLPARIALDGSWFEIAGERGDLSRRPVLRRVLAALVAHHAAGQRAPLSMLEVLAAGWPNERCVRDSGAARVYQTIKRLRQVGLGDVLDHDGRGYWLKGAPILEGPKAAAA
jgi:hypothetical protein